MSSSLRPIYGSVSAALRHRRALCRQKRDYFEQSNDELDKGFSPDELLISYRDPNVRLVRGSQCTL